jgi:hypothetical protein
MPDVAGASFGLHPLSHCKVGVAITEAIASFALVERKCRREDGMGTIGLGLVR